MELTTVNIENELQKQKNRKDDFINQVYSIFKSEEEKEEEIKSRLFKSTNKNFINIEIDKNDDRNVFTLNDIKEVSIKYRLRFLDSTHFKSEIPYPAISKIKEFEKKYEFKIQEFKILAPFGVFDLQDINQDPLLFAKLDENRFFLLHKWGNDLNVTRKFLNFPFRSIYHFFVSNLILAFVFSMSFPLSVLNVTPEQEPMMRLWFCTHCLIAFFSFSLFLGSLSFKGFSSNTWNSSYFNE